MTPPQGYGRRWRRGQGRGYGGGYGRGWQSPFLAQPPGFNIGNLPGRFRVAVPSQGANGLDDTVSPVFARAPSFIFADVDNGNIVSVRNIRNPYAEMSQGAGYSVAEWIASQGVKVVIGETFNSKDAPNEVAREIGGKAIFLNPIPSGDYVEAISRWSRAICKAMKGE
jgi:hypothetical protein